MRSFPITVYKGNVTHIKVIMLPVGHGYATQAFKTIVKGNFTFILYFKKKLYYTF